MIYFFSSDSDAENWIFALENGEKKYLKSIFEKKSPRPSVFISCNVDSIYFSEHEGVLIIVELSHHRLCLRQLEFAETQSL